MGVAPKEPMTPMARDPLALATMLDCGCPPDTRPIESA